MDDFDRKDAMRKLVALSDAYGEARVQEAIAHATRGGPRDFFERYYHLRGTVFMRAKFAAELFDDDRNQWLDAAADCTLPETRERIVLGVIDGMYEHLRTQTTSANASTKLARERGRR